MYQIPTCTFYLARLRYREVTRSGSRTAPRQHAFLEKRYSMLSTKVNFRTYLYQESSTLLVAQVNRSHVIVDFSQTCPNQINNIFTYLVEICKSSAPMYP